MSTVIRGGTFVTAEAEDVTPNWAAKGANARFNAVLGTAEIVG